MRLEQDFSSTRNVNVSFICVCVCVYMYANGANFELN